MDGHPFDDYRRSYLFDTYHNTYLKEVKDITKKTKTWNSIFLNQIFIK